MDEIRQKSSYVSRSSFVQGTSSRFNESENPLKAVLIAWGQNKHSELGFGTSVNDQQSISWPRYVPIRSEPQFVGAAAEHSILVTKTNRIRMCGLNIHNRFCEGEIYGNSNPKDGNFGQKIEIKKFSPIKKDLLNQKKIVKAFCGDYHTTVLTQDEHLFSWGGSASYFMEDNL